MGPLPIGRSAFDSESWIYRRAGWSILPWKDSFGRRTDRSFLALTVARWTSFVTADKVITTIVDEDASHAFCSMMTNWGMCQAQSDLPVCQQVLFQNCLTMLLNSFSAEWANQALLKPTVLPCPHQWCYCVIHMRKFEFCTRLSHGQWCWTLDPHWGPI